ncbi:MAG: class I SAM-dependent methyltransferase [Pseudomonadota bacterium]
MRTPEEAFKSQSQPQQARPAQSGPAQAAALTPNDQRALDALRDQIGPVFGSQTLCMLLHVLALREKPSRVIELGTGLGVTTAWIAAAMAKNRDGRIVTIDNGAMFPLKNEAFAAHFRQMFPEVEDHVGFMERLAGSLSFGDRIEYINQDVDFSSPNGLLQSLQVDKSAQYDWVFCDVIHGPEAVEACFAGFLAIAAPSFSLFIDSASTLTESFLLAERMVDQLRRGKIPEVFNDFEDDEVRDRVRALAHSREFTIHHFTEQVDNAQNSTMLIKAFPVDAIPYPATFMR